MRAIQYILTGACFLGGVSILFLSLVTVYAVEPVEFTWGTDHRSAGEERLDDIEGEVAASEITPLCEPRFLDQPSISYATIAKFATDAVLAINSYDYLNWDQAIPAALNQYFTPAAARSYYNQFSRSNLLRTIQSSYYTVSALVVRPPIVTSSTKGLTGPREWEVQVPVTLYYQTGASTIEGGTTANKQTQIFSVRVIEQPPTQENFRGVGVVGFTTSAVRSLTELEAMR